MTAPTVFIVLDPEYGSPVASLKRAHRLWVVDSPLNRAAWETEEAAYPNSAIFVADSGRGAAEVLAAALTDVEDHFGPSSSEEPYERVVVVGIALDEYVARKLQHLGLIHIRATSDGFEAQVVRN